ncbi:MAG: SCO1664 family protein [Chloroflexi bacterium]|nr:MAG: SCO1664 family protein [Chloroflexota bacterium]TMD66082.1 MAG: SCO1664 family protein [Chloroflexota bacterium]
MAQAARFLESEARQRLLRTGRIKPRGLMPDCSNYTYLAQVRGPDGAETFGVYKPAEGETPLDDFPEGTLGKREVAAFLVSAALGWNVVPLTIYRQDGPLGPGSLQQFVVADLREHYFSLMPARASTFRTMAAFDVIVNNADRKSGHCLLDRDGHIWGVDNGLTFHSLPKLRTVIWEFGGEEIPPNLRHDAQRLAGELLAGQDLVKELRALITGPEIRALAQRAGRVADDGRYPEPTSRWAYPWPLV